MNFFRKRSVEQNENEENDTLAEDILLSSLTDDTIITSSEAMEIPAVASCIDIIADIIASCPIKLYIDVNENITEIKDDKRISLLNDDTKDTLTSNEFWHAIIEDLLLEGSSYAYLNKFGNLLTSVHYVSRNEVYINKNTDPIFKKYIIIVNGKTYFPCDFLKFTLRSKDGSTGKGILKTNQLILNLAYNTYKYEVVLVATGGNKKGFLKSAKKLNKESIDKLKSAWRRLYSNNKENVVVLNDGIEFQEASNTSVEMQLNENKNTNSKDIYSLFHVPQNVVDGSANSEEYTNFIKVAIIPIMDIILSSLNRDLLLESEKNQYFFAFDTKELLKGDIEKRYTAYASAINSHWMQPEEVRYIENLPKMDLDFIQLGLDSVLYYPKSKSIYTPNTNKTISINTIALEGGENNENRNKEQ